MKKHPGNWDFAGPLKENYCYIGLRIVSINYPDLTFKRSIYLILILLGNFIHQVQGQVTLDTIFNHYASIEEIIAYEKEDVDSVVVTSLPPGFEEDDTVMIYCVQGAEIRLTEPDIGRDDQNPRNTGKYAFLIIDKIIGNTLVLNTTVRPEIGPLGDGEVAQLIDVPSYHQAEVTSLGVTAPPWNGSTGGVVALFVRTTLILNGSINVSGKGFRGAIPSELYNGECSSTDPDLYDSAFYHISSVRAGKKGESTNDTRFDLMRGKAMNINGGGGGNALYSGGGGGSNFSSGGRGGNESSQCAPGIEAAGGAGGFDLGRSDAYYLNWDEDNTKVRYDRIFFGGGGGTGTRISERTTTAGGNGGGLVVIIADTIDGNGGNWIRADGNDVATPADGAGGGGGGGGGIILDVSGYKNNLRLSAVGGGGGDTNHPSDTTGPGGGGGGGIYWLAGSDEPGVNPNANNGKSGEHHSVPRIKYGAADGSFPDRKDGLEAPLLGFLFNSVPSAFWICSDQVPETIFASKPKGGHPDSAYVYTWLDSSSTQNAWLPAPGNHSQKDYDFEGRKLSDTTYFRRVVTSGSVLDPDTSFRIAVYVHHAITNNTVAAHDTVCWGNAPLPFAPLGEPGAGLGPGSYSYRWMKDEGSGSYTDAGGNDTVAGYAPPGLEITTDFVRITYSGVCIDTSETLNVTVFDTLTGNTITPFDTICWNTRPELITGPVPDGGEELDKRYEWQSGPSITGPWSDEGVTTRDYRPGQLTGTTWYRRVALSGSDDACDDFSPPVEILNIDAISSNAVLPTEQAVCWFDQPDILQGSDPGGGYQGLYSYSWESRTLSTGWTDADDTHGNDQKSYSPPVLTGDTTWFRRVVGSGGAARDVCTDPSDSVVINVLPSITNNAVLPAEDVKCQFDLLGDLTQDVAGGAEPGGGATQGGGDPTRNYKWEQATGMGTPGDNWTEVSYGPGEIDYNGFPELTDADDYWYRRIVFSGPDLGGQNQVCSDTSGLIQITIHTAITGNTIDPADSACFNSTKVLHGATPAGEPGLNPSYSWWDHVAGTEFPDSDGQDYPHLFVSHDPHQFKRLAIIGECEDTSNVMMITVMELPGATLSGDLSKACEKTIQLDVDLDMDELTRFVTPWEVSLSDGVNPLLEPQALEADGTVDVELSTDEISTHFDYTIGRLVYTLTDGTECVAPPEKLLGNVPIEVFLTPEPEITIETELIDQAVCDNEISLVVDPDHGTGTWTSDYPDDLGFLPDPAALSVRASIDPGDSAAWSNIPYTLYFTSEAGDCWGMDSVEISFFEQPETANAGADDTVYLSNSTWLDADPATAGEGTWTVTSGAGTFEDEHDPKTFVYGLTKGERNEFLWTIVNGVCITSDDWSVITQDRAQPYEGFSPNGNGINDYFIIRGLGDLDEGDEFTISFFNALGRTVRTITHENIHEVEYDEAMIPGGLQDYEAVVWEGKARDGNGPQVPPGTYYYVIRIVKRQADGSTDESEEKHYVVVRE